MSWPRPMPEPGYPPCSPLAREWEEPTAPLDLLTGAGRLGAWVWEERRLHRLAGSWAVGASASDAVTTFDRVAMRHAWRAEVLLARLPQLRELPVARLVVPGPDAPGPRWEQSLATASDGRRRDAWASNARERIGGYRDHLARTSEVADAPLRRWLPLVIDSLVEDLAAVGSLRDG